jgi:hypothetical protein
MKTNASLAVCLALLSGLTAASLRAQNPSPANTGIRSAAQTLVSVPSSQEDLETVRLYARDPQSPPALKSRAMAAYALTLLAKGETNQFERARLMHAAAFADDQKLIPLRISDCLASCPVCGGQRTQRPVCATCYGKGTVLNLPQEKIADAFASALNEIVALVNREEALVNREEALSQKFAKAKAETDRAKRIAAFQALLGELDGHPEREEVASLLQADEHAQRQQAERERAALADQALKKLQALAGTPNLAAGVLTLEDYLAKNPDSPARLEAKIILSGLLAKIESKRKKERMWYIIGGALFVLAALSCVHVNVFKYVQYSHNKTVPAGAHTTRTEAEQFTDPLSLNAQDSLSRVKCETARIPAPDDHARER